MYRRRLLPLIVHFVFVAGCAHYSPAPLAPAETLRQLETRSLADADLRAFIATNEPDAAKDWPRKSWDLPTLTLTAFFFHPSLDVARANVAVVQSGIVTANARPNPSVGFGPEYTGNPGAGNSAWTLGLNFDLPIETAGKRGYRVAHAEQLTEATKLQLAEAAWVVRSRVRVAFVEHLLAQRETDLLQTEIAARAEVVRRMEQRFEAGDVSRTEVDAARTQFVQSRVAARTVAGHVQQTRGSLAAALGLPPAALDGVALEWPEMEKLPDAQALSATAIQDVGLLNRLDVRRALADYAGTERALQLQFAKQYPDVRLVPGYTFDQGDHRFALGVGVELPVLNRNEGPIAEARARRAKAAVEFLALQAQVIGELAKARAQYDAALAELGEVEGSLTELQLRTEKLTRRAVELGEADRLALASVRLQGVVVARARFDALRRAQTALGALEDAVQRPLVPSTPLPEIPADPHREVKELK